MSYAQPIFMPQGRYRAKQDFKGGPASTFLAGETLTFERDSYSPYDNCFVYVFRTEDGGETKEWWLAGKEPKAAWQQHFEQLP